MIWIGLKLRLAGLASRCSGVELGILGRKPLLALPEVAASPSAPRNDTVKWKPPGYPRGNYPAAATAFCYDTVCVQAARRFARQLPRGGDGLSQ